MYKIIHLSIMEIETVLESFYNEDLAYRKLAKYMQENPICIFYIKEEK